MLSNQDILQIMESSQALLSGHFKLSSGRHSERYLQCAQALQYPDKARALGGDLAERLKELLKGAPVHAVASPAVGGLVIGQEVALGLGARSIFSERGEDGKMVFRRGFYISPGENVVLADDVLTTGKSFRELLEIVHPTGAKVVALAAVAERGFHAKDFETPRRTLLQLDFKDFDPSDCPLCRQNVPLTKPGSRPAANV